LEPDGRKSRTAEAVLIAALLVLSANVAVFYGRLTRYHEYVEATKSHVARSSAISRLVNLRLPSLILPTVDGADAPLFEPGRFSLMWVVNPHDCIGCLSGISNWNALAREPRVRTVLVLVGVDRDRAREIAQQTRVRGTVVYDPTGIVADRMGLELASTKLFVLPSGVTAMADSRPYEFACEWKLEDVVIAWLRSGEPGRT